VFPSSQAYEHGFLDAGDGNRVYWEVHGNPAGKAAVCLHGGPGSGCDPWWPRYFDPDRYRVVLVDQRGCGRSTPSAADPATDLSRNTTQLLIGDLERLRDHLGIGKWLLFGGSWGSTLGLAYAQAHPASVSQIVLFSICGTRRRDVEWVTREMGRVFPAEWERFAAVAGGEPDLAAAYARMLADPDPAVRERAALQWCRWEDTHVAVFADHQPDPRFDDPGFRMVFARLVTHYWANAAFLPETALLDGAGRLAGIPGVLVHGRMDVSGPPEFAWQLSRVWPDAELILVDDAAHGAGYPAMRETLLAALARFASPTPEPSAGP
jgi:proline iminopeptidase